ncbi:MAG: hypothetical protein CMI02_02075 [Oceanospirillaceae bacterium]|nr:hypothetical protein [Oceanospirillaceae bacterium]MBT10808.1 hypothetical protein [Oceanospirillaceae bacterium]
MKGLKLKLLILIAGIVLGAWVGSNWIRERPLFANPFAPATLGERLKDSGSDLLDSSKDMLEDGIDKLKK